MTRKERRAVYCIEASGEVVSSAVIGTICTGLRQLHISKKKRAAVVRRTRSIGRAVVRTCPAFHGHVLCRKAPKDAG
jgi:hypothetical protein